VKPIGCPETSVSNHHIIIIIIIIIILISFMQGIYTYIPETNYVPRQYSVAAILLFLFMVHTSLAPVLNLLHFYISTFRSMCAVSNMAVFIIIIIISFMQGIYTYIPETNYVPRQYSVAAILLFLFMVHKSLAPVLNLLHFYISTFRSMCAVSNMAVSTAPGLYGFLVCCSGIF
jgi:hypothetical protein